MTTMTRRAAISAAIATAAATPAAIAATTDEDSDPVFVLLECHREATARRDAVRERYGHLSLEEQQAVGYEETYAELDDTVMDIEHEIINTVPTSLAGIRAVLALAIEADGGDIAADDDDRDCLFANLVEALDQHIAEGPRKPN